MTCHEILKPHKQTIINQYKSGLSTNKIAQKFGVNSYYIWHLLKQEGVDVKSKQKFKGNIEDYKQDIIDRFTRGISCKQIAKDLGISKPTILRVLTQWGYDTSKHSKANSRGPIEQFKDQIISMYQKGMSADEIGAKLGYGGPTVWKALQKYNVDTSRKKIAVDEDFFVKIDTEEKAYVLGMIYADGNVKANLSGWRIGLAESDRDILDKIRAAVQYEGRLYFTEAKGRWQGSYTLCVHRSKMCKDLVRLGCGPTKSLTLAFPNEAQVPHDLMRHFVRGYFDGDGSIASIRVGPGGGTYMGSVSFTGSYDFISGLKEYLVSNNICDIGNIYQRYKNRDAKDSAHMIHIGKKKEKLKILNWLYQDATIYMDRKRNKAQELYGV